MTAGTTGIQHLTTSNVVNWYRQEAVEMIVGDALDNSTSAPMIIGFARYRKGATNEVELPYDEALIITRGVFTVRRTDGVATARAGEVIFHRAGVKVVYQADEDAEMVYVSYPALRLAPVGAFRPASQALVTQLTESSQ